MTVPEYLKIIDGVIEKGPYKDTVESLSSYPYPQWFEDAKFGIFLHWGVYSVPAFFSEWYPRMMYYWGNPVHAYHLLRYGKKFEYKDFIPQFKAEKFDAGAWLDFFRDNGVKFIMPVGEHHDGFKMYKSDLCKWNAAEMGPKRDILRELKESADNSDVTFCTSSHRAEHYWFENGGRTLPYGNDIKNDRHPDFYGPCFNPYTKNNLPTMLKQEKEGMVPTTEWLEDWLASSCEMIDNTQPSAFFFDWWVSSCEAFTPYVLKFAAYYANRAAEWGKTVCIFYKSDALKSNIFVYDRERTHLPDIHEKVWQCETSSSFNSWSYCTTNIFKKPAEIAAVLADTISKRGTFCLNFGPKADGTFCQKEIDIMTALGQWTKKNAEAIWGTRPYKVFGEGKEVKGGLYTEKYGFTAHDFRLTQKDNTVYCFALSPKDVKDNTFRVECLGKAAGHLTEKIKWVGVLGYKIDVSYSLNDGYLAIKTAQPIPTDMPICFKIIIE